MGIEPGALGDAMAAVLSHELDGADVHRDGVDVTGRYAAAIVRTDHPIRVQADLVIALPADGTAGELEVRRGEDRLRLPIGDDVVAVLVRILRAELDLR